MNFDHDLFLLLNFDGGTTLDRVMLTLSGTTMWLPLYALILWLVWRRNGWQRTLLFCVLILLAVALADMVAGIFKHSGLLGGLCPDLEPRLRPMFTPALEGLDITPDSLAVLRRAAPADARGWFTYRRGPLRAATEPSRPTPRRRWRWPSSRRASSAAAGSRG